MRTTIDESRKICSGSLIGSSFRRDIGGGCSQNPEIAFRIEGRPAPLVPSSRSEVGGVKETSFLVEDKKGDGGRETGPGRRTSVSRVSGSLTTSEKEAPGGAVLEAPSGEVESASGDSVISSGTVLSSSTPSSSSSASLDGSELSDSSLMASLTLSRTSTVARADATGRARLPRMTEYRLFKRSASRPRRSKCFAILDTVLPGPEGGLRNVDLFPELDEGREKVLSLGRLDVHCLLGLPLKDTFLTLDGDEGRLNLTSFPRPLDERLSGDCLREDD